MVKTKLLGVYPSLMKSKRLVALFDINGELKMVNFGAKSKTFLDHKDEDKRDDYIRQQVTLGTEDFNDPLTPASLSIFLLYGNHANLGMNIEHFKKTFKL